MALLMVFALVACTGDTNPTDSNTVAGSTNSNPVVTTDTTTDQSTFIAPTAQDWDPGERPADETEGNTYTIIQHSVVEDPFGYSQDSVLGLQIATRLTEVEEQYGCTLSFSQVAYSDQFATQLQALAYAENGGDLIFSNNNAQLRKALGTGGDESLCYDLLKFDHIINFWDMNKWGNITARECMMAGGTFYGVSPALWVDCTPLPYYTLVYNKDIIEAAGATSPQESWEKGEWDNYAMVEVAKATTNEADGIWGMTATHSHMTRATFLSTGLPLLNIEVASDASVTWKSNLDAPEAIAAFQWLKNTLTANAKCFNKGGNDWDTWKSQEPFNEELCAMTLTRPLTLFGDIVVNGPTNFGIATWAGSEANLLTGYYENVYAIAIPTFAQNADHSAFLMFDLFKGLDDAKDYSEVKDYYLNTYFSSEADMTCLIREGANLQYSYWPNGCDAIWNQISSGLAQASSVAGLIGKHIHIVDAQIEENIVPNQVQLKAWKEAGKFD